MKLFLCLPGLTLLDGVTDGVGVLLGYLLTLWDGVGV